MAWPPETGTWREGGQVQDLRPLAKRRDVFDVRETGGDQVRIGQ